MKLKNWAGDMAAIATCTFPQNFALLGLWILRNDLYGRTVDARAMALALLGQSSRGKN